MIEQGNFAVQELYIAGNRGPCGGVNMALQTVTEVLKAVDGREPVYVPWDPTHNNITTRGLLDMGMRRIPKATSGEIDWESVPRGGIVVYPAHGIPPAFQRIAAERELLTVDVTCQLVSKVHRAAIRAQNAGEHVYYVGVQGHPETEGVLGELEPDNYTLLQKPTDLETLKIPEDIPGVVLSQTTLSMREVGEIYRDLSRYPQLKVVDRLTICYATDNRQQAADVLLDMVKPDLWLVVGSPHSHNSQELRKKGLEPGRGTTSVSLDTPEEIQKEWFGEQVRKVGITSGASVPEDLLSPVVEWFILRDPSIRVQYMDQVRDEDPMKTFTKPKSDLDKIYKRYPTSQKN